MPVVEAILLAIKLSVEVRVLLFPVYEEVLLIVDFLPQGLDNVDVNFNSASVVLLHSPLIVGNPVEILLQGEQLVLQILVFSFSSSQVHRFLSELGY